MTSHATEDRRLRRTLSRIPLADTGEVQYRRRRQRRLGGARSRADLSAAFQPRRRASVAHLRCLRDALVRIRRRARGAGVRPGDRVAILLPQGFEAAIAHAAIYKLGAVALPLALLFGVEALAYRLQDAEVSAIVTNRFGYERIAAIRGELTALRLVVLAEADEEPGTLRFRELVSREGRFDAADTTPDDPALMIYTSGTTGPPKGPCMVIAFCSATCRDFSSIIISCRSRATGCGPRPTGPGPAAS